MKLHIVHDRKLWKAPTAPKSAEAPDEFARLKRFESGLSLEAEDAKKFTEVKADGVITDYRDVSFKGYMSTFKGTTESDRHGDYVDDGAFRETIAKFLKNPVVLRDHTNLTTHLVGVYTKVKEDRTGLYVEAKLSNAPDVRDVRFKVAEGILKTLSMGGIFHYKEDGRGIFKVDLWEGSLVPIPANPDALISTRALTEDEKRFVKAGGGLTFFQFLQASNAQNRVGLAA